MQNPALTPMYIPSFTCGPVSGPLFNGQTGYLPTDASPPFAPLPAQIDGEMPGGLNDPQYRTCLEMQPSTQYAMNIPTTCTPFTWQQECPQQECPEPTVNYSNSPPSLMRVEGRKNGTALGEIVVTIQVSFINKFISHVYFNYSLNGPLDIVFISY